MKGTSKLLLCLFFTLVASLVLAAPYSSPLTDWEAAFSKSSDYQPQLPYKATDKTLVRLSPKGPYLHLRNHFQAPPAEFNKVMLWFGAVKFTAKVYVNGHQAGTHFGGWTPFEIDATPYLRPGRNEVVVAAGDVTRIIKPEKLTPEALEKIYTLKQTWPKASLLAPVGSYSYKVGLWDGAEVRAYRTARVQDVKIVTSVRKHTFSAQVMVENFSGRPLKVVVLPRILGQGKTPRPRFLPETLTLEAHGKTTLTFSKPWQTPDLWTPEAPRLYTFQVTLADYQARQKLDERRTRFGFRELWKKGDKVLLNGTPLVFRGTAGHPDPDLDVDILDWAKAHNCNTFRLHANVWPEKFYTHADEIGMLLVEESANWCHGGNYALDDPAFWQNLRTHWQRIIARDKNHPSVVLYSLENELLLTGGTWYPKAEEKLGELADYVRSLDSTRLIMCDGDDDPAGKMDVINLHYPHEYPAHYNFPEDCYWLEKAITPDTYPKRAWQWKRKKPLYIGEFLCIPEANACRGAALLGDAAFGGYAARVQAKAKAWSYQIDAYRALGVTGYCPWTAQEERPGDEGPLWQVVKAHYTPVEVLVREQNRRFFAGAEVKRTCYVLNDSPRALECKLTWRLKRQGKVVASDSYPVSLQPAERKRYELAFTAPDVGLQPEPFTFEVVLEGVAGARNYRAECYSYPRQALHLPQGVRFGLYDPSGDTIKALGELPFKRLSSLEQPLKGLDVLVIGAGALKARADELPVAGKPLNQALRSFLAEGGRVVVLPQQASVGNLVPLTLAKAPCVRIWPLHPMPGLSSQGGYDFWGDDGYCAEYVWHRPERGNHLAWFLSAASRGFEYSPCLKVSFGKGAYYLCQLEVVKKFDSEPLARYVLQSLLEQAARPERKLGELAVLGAKEKLGKVLDQAGFAWHPASEGEESEVLLVAHQAFSEQIMPRLQSALMAGTSVILHNLQPEQTGLVEKLTRDRLTLAPASPRGVTRAKTGGKLAEFLCLQDLWWRPFLNWQQQEKPSDVVPLCTALPTLKPPPSPPLEVLAGHIFRQPNGNKLNLTGDVVNLYMSSITAEATFHLPASGLCALCVRAWGTPLGGIYPLLGVSVDGGKAQVLQVKGTPREWTVSMGELSAGEHKVALRFLNDASNATEDRNCFFDRVAVYQLRAWPDWRAEFAPAVLSSVQVGKGRLVLDQVQWENAGPYQLQARRYLAGLLSALGLQGKPKLWDVQVPGSAFKLMGKAKYSGPRGKHFEMAGNGTLKLEVEFATSGRYQLDVVGGGSELKGIYPAITFKVDGRKVGDYQYLSPGPEDAYFIAEVTAGKHEIEVEYTNDEYAPPEDRNFALFGLKIRKLTGQEVEALVH